MNIDMLSATIGFLLGVFITSVIAIIFIRQQKLKQENALEVMKSAFEHHFVQLADQALSKNSDSFLKLAQQNFEKHQHQASMEIYENKSNIYNIVKPLSEHLDRFESAVRNLEQRRENAYSSVETQLKNIDHVNERLRTETSRLVQALKQPRTRGKWGEIQLRNVLEYVGMTKFIDYVEQPSFEVGQKRYRPDVIVHLPGNRNIVIDAKTPFDSFHLALEAESDVIQKKHLQNHAKNVRKQVNKLASQNYQEIVANSPDFVVMFIPAEASYFAAIEHDNELFEFAVHKGIIIATPWSLVLLLKIIELSWEENQLTENTKKIAELGKNLNKTLHTLIEQLTAHGKELNKLRLSYNRIVKNVDQELMPNTAKLKELHVASAGKKLDNPKTIDSLVQKFQSSKFD